MSKLKYLIITILLAALILPVLWSTARGSLFKVSGPPDDGLVGRWTMERRDLRSSTVIVDRSSNSNDGTLVNGPTFSSPGPNGRSQAMSFDGTNDYVSLPNDSDLRPNQITVSAWVNPLAVDGSRNILDSSSASPWYGYLLRIYNGKVNAEIYVGSSQSLLGSTTIPTGLWSHIAMTYDGSNLKIWLNGVNDGNLPLVGSINYTMTVAPSIGARYTGSAQFFNGSISDVRIYNRVLSATEVTSLYNSYRPKQAISSLQKGLVGHWKLDQASNKSTTVTADATPYGNNGTSSGSPTLGGATDQHGQASRATTFDGTDDFVDINDMSTLDGQSYMSTFMWVKPTSLGSAYSLLTKWDYQTQGNFLVQLASTGRLDISIASTLNDAGNNYRISTSNLTAGQWSHVGFVYDGTQAAANRLKLFINGVDVSGSSTGTIAATTTSGTATVKIGRIGGTLTQYFNGSISDVRIYNRVLSATEVTSLYNSYRPVRQISSLYKGLVLDMPLAQADLKSATTIADKTPYSNTGTLVGSPTFTTDRHGQSNKAMSFVAGSSQKVTVGNIGNVKSVAFWAKLNSTTEKILELIDDNTYIHNNAGTITATGFTSPTIYVDGAAASTISDTNWHHIVVITGTNVAAASTTIGEANATYLTGSIHSVKVWNRALSATEVGALYQSYK